MIGALLPTVRFCAKLKSRMTISKENTSLELRSRADARASLRANPRSEIENSCSRASKVHGATTSTILSFRVPGTRGSRWSGNRIRQGNTRHVTNRSCIVFPQVCVEVTYTWLLAHKSLEGLESLRGLLRGTKAMDGCATRPYFAASISINLLER